MKIVINTHSSDIGFYHDTLVCLRVHFVEPKPSVLGEI